MNFPTIFIASSILIVFISIIYFDIKKKKNGTGSCSCGCSGCAMSEVCHKEKQ